MNLALDHWHIEPSSICTLKCPRCPRAEVPESLLNRQLDLSFFQTQLGEVVVSGMKKVTFCGNDGDPIYCRELIEICSWMKSVNHRLGITIITNGSYRDGDWWQRLGRVLDHRDELHWSLDGWDQDSNQKYRVNSDWSSIKQGVREFRMVNEETYTVWAAIAFRFNQEHLDRMRDLANDWQFDAFQMTKSTKFGSHYPDAYGNNDELEPTQSNLISSSHRFERVLQPITDRVRPGAELKQIFSQRAQEIHTDTGLAGICLIGNKGVFLNSQGEFYPCCWTANRYEHNSNWHQLAQTQFNLRQHSFQEIISDPFWHNEFLQFDSYECRTKCTRERLSDAEHTTEW